MNDHDVDRRFTRTGWLLTALAAAFSGFVFLWTQVSMLGWHSDSFRNYYQGDQLSNFAVVVNAAHGNFSAVEPFTETGTLNDPHLYLEVLGGLSRLTGISATDMWNAGGVLLQLVLVLCISVSAAVVSRRWWAASLGAIPFLVGTLSFGYGGWYTVMQSHGVLWAAFAVMFPLNEGSAALAIGGIVLVLLIAVARRVESPRWLVIAGTAAALGVGLLANIDTYSFFVAIFFSLYGLAVFAMTLRGAWIPWALSAALLVVLFFVGPPFATHVGRLDTFALGLIPALPGIALALGRWRLAVLVPLVAAVAAAAPQLISVSTSLAGGNAFLKFREAASTSVGVIWQDGLRCAAPLLIPLAMILLAGIHQKRPLWIAYAAGTTVAWFVVATNDRWGTNQEPYQLWIDSFALVAFTIVPVAVDVVTTYLSRAGRHVATWPWRSVIACFTAAAIGIAGWSSVDWLRFYQSQEGQLTALATPYDHSTQVVAAHISNDQLVMTDPCTNPYILKAVTGVRVDVYNLGLAWPAKVTQILALGQAAEKGVVKPALVKAAGVGWLISNGECTVDWPKTFRSELIPVASSRYGPAAAQVVGLWRWNLGAGQTSRASG